MRHSSIYPFGWLAMTFLGSLLAADQLKADTGEGGPGALSAWESTDPIVVKARSFVDQGRFVEAGAMLATHLDAPDPAASKARREMMELADRLQWEYGLDAEALWSRIRKTMPDGTQADLDRWRAAGSLQWREIEGTVRYYRREPVNFFRFCDEAKPHAPPARLAAAEADSAAMREHIERVIAEAQRSGETQVLPAHFRVRYTINVHPAVPGVREGDLVRAWLPYPQEYRHQTNARLVESSPGHGVIAPTAAGEMPLHGAPQRSVYLEQRPDRKRPTVFSADFEFKTAAYYPKLDDAAAQPLAKDYAGGCLAERPPHIRFTPEVLKLAEEITRGHDNPLDRARQIFRWVSENIAYAAEEEYCLIPSLSAKALAKRKGDCGVKAMTFITLCRAAGIPARWQSGWMLGPGDPDMHDWAEFYVAPWGWLPADPSRGLQKSERADVRDFYFGHLDAYRLIVNRDYGCELQPAKSSTRSEPLDFQRGEVEVDGVNLYFDQWDYDIAVERIDGVKAK